MVKPMNPDPASQAIEAGWGKAAWNPESPRARAKAASARVASASRSILVAKGPMRLPDAVKKKGAIDQQTRAHRERAIPCAGFIPSDRSSGPPVARETGRSPGY